MWGLRSSKRSGLSRPSLSRGYLRSWRQPGQHTRPETPPSRTGSRSAGRTLCTGSLRRSLRLICSQGKERGLLGRSLTRCLMQLAKGRSLILCLNVSRSGMVPLFQSVN
uniref:Uncharacterized protein n=1 Tax=Opuntia streptacantha TaxID=393608 RepID=A0A7C9EX09_OPUST